MVGLYDADSNQWGPCTVAVMNKFTGTTEVLWRKGTAQPLSECCLLYTSDAADELMRV